MEEKQKQNLETKQVNDSQGKTVVKSVDQVADPLFNLVKKTTEDFKRRIEENIKIVGGDTDSPFIVGNLIKQYFFF